MDFKSRFNNKTSFASKSDGYHYDISQNSRKSSATDIINNNNNNYNRRTNTFSASSQNTYYNYSPTYEVSTYRQYENDNYLNNNYDYSYNSYNNNNNNNNNPYYQTYYQQPQQQYHHQSYNSSNGNYNDNYYNSNRYQQPQQYQMYNDGYYTSHGNDINQMYEFSDTSPSFEMGSNSFKSNYKNKSTSKKNKQPMYTKKKKHKSNQKTYTSKSNKKSTYNNRKKKSKEREHINNNNNNKHVEKYKKKSKKQNHIEEYMMHNNNNHHPNNNSNNNMTNMTTSAKILSEYPSNNSRRSNRSYKPYTLKEYKQIPKEIKTLPSLGPDLENEELIKKKERAKQINDYSRQIRLENAKRIIKSSKKSTPKNEKQEKVTISSRERAWEFAKSLPKPVVTVQPPKSKKKPTKEKKSDIVSLDELSRRNEHARKEVDHIRKLLKYTV